MTANQWPTDEHFRKVAAKIADVVTVAINSGKVVSASPSPDTVCPLGCDCSTRKRPWHVMQLNKLRDIMFGDEFCEFVDGFDREFSATPMQALGRAYRKRFP